MAAAESMTVAQARQLLGKDFNRMNHRGGDAAGLVARGRKREQGMNKLEKSYEDEVLIPALVAGEIQWYAYEALKLRLADSTFLTVDFFVMTKAGDLEARETKGFWEEDARVKIKVAAAMYPFRFIAIQKATKKDGGGWVTEVFE